jgi:hypothetical protein
MCPHPRVPQGVLFSVLLVLSLSFQSAGALAAVNSESLPEATFDCANVTEIPQAECRALVALYNSTNGPGWKHLNGWLHTNTACSWYGVGCRSGHVAELSLGWNQLGGPIPSELGDLSRLTVLWLGSNQLSGPIPLQLVNLSNLRTLGLGGNQLSGSIPWQLGLLGNLGSLWLWGNHLSGSIPWQLANLSNLDWLGINDNPLSGSIPTSLTALHLVEFDFGNTNLCEPVDAAFQTWLHGIRFLSGAGVICRAPTPTPTPPCTVPALPSPYSLRVNAGGPAYTDTTGVIWQADREYAYCSAPYWGATGGQVYTTTRAIGSATDQTLFQSERYFASQAGYRFAVPNGQYLVQLRFAEIYPYAYGGGRIFDVRAEGQTIASKLDVLARSGGLYRADDITASVTVADGELSLDFVTRPGRNAPFVNAIAVTQLQDE